MAGGADLDRHPVILALNAGSSSLKFSLFEIGSAGAFPLLAGGQIEGIGDAPHFSARDGEGRVISDEAMTDRRDAAAETFVPDLLDFTTERVGQARLVAIGHRVVHGGPHHAGPAFVTQALMDDIAALAPLAPLHQRHSLAPMQAIAGLRPTLPQIACFDTSFHQTMPQVATRFALPAEVAAPANGLALRRYGFHGLSYEYISGFLRDTLPELSRGRVVVAHLGSGASLCALRDGRSVETTMGMTPLDGLMMGTRSGAIDPGVLLYLLSTQGMTGDDLAALLYQRSGLLGVSGISSDLRKIHASSEPAAAEAIALFVYRLVREIGAMAAVLGGLDGLVFTAGIGVHDATIRAMCCARLRWLGVELDEVANTRAADDVRTRISAPASHVAVEVIPTDEQLMIARHTAALLGQPSPDPASASRAG